MNSILRSSLGSSITFSLVALSLVLLPCGLSLAQSVQQSAEGIVGDVDKGRRAPVVTFTTEVAADGTSAKILADTQIINEDFKKYPIVVDFFVNGKLFSKQFRSIELPAPIGIDVPTELAPVPFNFSIVATLLHPNRQYVTVVQGAVTNDSTGTSFECAVTETVGGDATGVALTGLVAPTLGSDNIFKFTLTNDDKSADVSLTVEPTASSTSLVATGSAEIQQGATDSVKYDLTGTLDASGTLISAVNVQSAAGELTVVCQTIDPVTTSAATVDDNILDGDSSAEGLEGILDSAGNTGATLSPDGSFDEGFGTGPNGESNFIPLDKVDGVTVVN